MLRSKFTYLFQSTAIALYTLTRKRRHQIDIDIRKSDPSCQIKILFELIVRVDTS